MFIKKETFNPPESIVVDGEKVTFHYNRKERISMSGTKSELESSNKFFSKKYRYLHILLLDIVIICVIGLIYSNTVGKNDVKTINHVEYSLSRKYYGNNKILSASIQIKNKSSEPINLSKDQLTLVLTNTENKTIYSRDITPSSKDYNKDEFYFDTIIINDLASGRYKAYILLNDKSVVNVGIRIK